MYKIAPVVALLLPAMAQAASNTLPNENKQGQRAIVSNIRTLEKPNITD
ncbi:MAG: hypothetical protein GY834_03085 [Bacteroidetes bacterium]|nr:hypothetical protein [Bacteroidota bacterium]